MHNNIRVRIHGCVRKPGSYILPTGATAHNAIFKAGGFGGQGYDPSGIVSIRSQRGKDGLYYQRCKINYRRNPELLNLPLCDNDLVVVQFNIDSGNI